MRRAFRERGSSATRGVVVRTPGSVLGLIGRVVLWSSLGLLLLRGVGDVLSARPAQSKPQPAPSASAAWPDDEARAFAVGFARAYLSFSPDDPDGYARAVQRFAAGELRGSIVAQLPEHGDGQAVEDAVVARVARLSSTRALVTVAASVSADKVVSTRFLTVPVARDGRGGLVVDDLPSFSPPPAAGGAERVERDPLSGSGAGEIQDVLEKFFADFLAGRSGDLEYMLAPGARVGAVAQPYALLGVDSVTDDGPVTGSSRWVIATLRARDEQTGATYSLGYRVRLVRTDRWLVSAINTTEGK